ncbi:amidase family protein [Mycoplasma phocimorsus]|uniref:Amidase family protein n=1 Tax=Mycoplasma phocimorsus TaxID=3045839 RepID=A0AAJ1UZE7_9MOLU|nr:amidase family protein [Mycoplasma phocimorsus]MDJ1645658.1 amidase family protein [Mycoplasma phocimorsus]MDJ1646777.1 amidase family protein [Mycoplasma phocimorsus]
MKVKGNLEQAINELKNDNNNAVANVLQYKTNNEGLLKDVVFSIKENYAFGNFTTTASSDFLVNFKTFYNSDVLKLLLDQGAIAIAKVHCDEFALGGTGTFSSHGIIKNPLDSSRYVGGSSSGSAATFSSNISFALGSDTGDSVRLPAAYIGSVGFKPSYGAISRYGLFAYASSLDTVAFFTHNVNDANFLAKILYKKSNNDLTQKIVKSELPYQKPNKVLMFDMSDVVEEYMTKSMKKLKKILEKEQIQVDFIKPELDMVNAIKPVYEIISFSEGSSNLSNLNGIAFGTRVEKSNSWKDTFMASRKHGLGKMVQRRLTLGSLFLKEENQKDLFLRAAKVRRLYKDYINSLFEKYEYIIYPSSAGIAPKFDDQAKNNYSEWILTGSNLVGNPSITLPIAKHNSLPYSIAIDSELYSDAKLLEFASYIEKLIGGK